MRDEDRRDAQLLFERAKLAVLAAGAGGAFGFLATRSWLGAVVGAPLGAWLSWKYIDGVGWLGSKLYLGSTTTPPPRDFSRAKALAIQGKYEAAIQQLERDIAEKPSEPEPYLLLARLLRDRLGRHEDAASWFRRARIDSTMNVAEEVLVTRELIELYTRKMGQPQRAIPELARIAERSGGTATGEWARTELATIRARMLEEHRVEG